MSTPSQASRGKVERATPESFRATALAASLTVKDIAASLAWYQDVVGFTVDQRHEREGNLIAVSLKAGSVRILLNRDDGKRGTDRVKGEGFSLQFTTSQGIDELATRMKSRGAALEADPADMPWGVRMFRVRDPDGFKLVFSSEKPT